MRRIMCVLLLSGCGAGVAPEPRTFDLGLEAPGTRLPAVRIGAVRAVAPFEATDMQYRLAYRNPAEIAAFAHSRWAATPAEMLRKQLQRAAGETPGKCTLEVEIQEFSQVFAAKEASEARIEMRVALSSPARALGRQFTVIEGNAGPDAASGAVAFARAANRAIADLGAWIGEQALCR